MTLIHEPAVLLKPLAAGQLWQCYNQKHWGKVRQQSIYPQDGVLYWEVDIISADTHEMVNQGRFFVTAPINGVYVRRVDHSPTHPHALVGLLFDPTTV